MFSFKKVLHFITSFLLRFLVYATATATVLLIIAGSSGHIKEALNSSGAYTRFVPSIIDSNKDSKDASSIPLSDPQVERIINEAFSPRDLKLQSDTIIDSVFAWLQGDAENVTFTVDFTKNKNQLGDKLSEYAFTNLAFKDPCIVQPAEFDPFTSECRPEYFDIFQGQKDFAAQIQASDGFLGNTVLTEQNLPKNKAGKNIFEQYSYAPTMYAWLKVAPYLLGGLTVLAGAGYIWSTPSRRRGVSKLGRGVIANSATLIVTPLVFGFLIPWISKNYTADLAGSSAEVLLNDIVNSVSREFNSLMIWFGSLLLLGGLLVVVAEKMTRAKARYSGVERKSGLATSNEAKSKLASPRGKLTETTLPLQSSELSATKKAKPHKKNPKYRKIPL